MSQKLNKLHAFYLVAPILYLTALITTDILCHFGGVMVVAGVLGPLVLGFLVFMGWMLWDDFGEEIKEFLFQAEEKELK